MMIVPLWLIFFACCLVAWPIKTIFMQNFTLFYLFIYLFTYFRGEGEVDKSFFVKDTPKPFDDF